jgi:hypothetical protein
MGDHGVGVAIETHPRADWVIDNVDLEVGHLGYSFEFGEYTIKITRTGSINGARKACLGLL